MRQKYFLLFSMIAFGLLNIIITRVWYSSNGILLTLGSVPSPVVKWEYSMLVSVLFLAAVGYAVNKRWDGIFIDERNKISLSRLQIVLWTIVIMPALLALIGTRAQVAAKELDTTLVRLTLVSPNNAPIDPAVVEIPEELWLLMGISTVSLVGSPLIRSQTQKQNKNPDLSDPQVKANLGQEKDASSEKKAPTEGNVVVNASAADASWADIFRAELANNSQLIDMAKVQNFIFTLFLIGIYVATLAQALKSEVLADKLPAMSAGMVTLLGISHAGYLIAKGTQQVPQEPLPTSLPPLLAAGTAVIEILEPEPLG